jgi:hypothetical protein
MVAACGLAPIPDGVQLFNSLCRAKSRRVNNQFMAYHDSKTLITGFYIWINENQLWLHEPVASSAIESLSFGFP